MCVSVEELPQDAYLREKAILTEKAKEQGKKLDMIDKIVEGQLKKWAQEKCLLDQQFFKNQELTMKQLLQETISKIGENVVIRRFVRYELGEGIDKKQTDFAQEVAAQVKGS